MSDLDLLLHPVRTRIVNAFAGGVSLTTRDLCARLPRVPQATLYRHVARLAAAGILEIVDEQPVGGAVERHYRLNTTRATIPATAGRTMTRSRHRRAFGATVASLAADFDDYITRRDAKPFDDMVGYRHGTVWLSPTEVKALARDIQQLLAAHGNNRADGDRRPYRIGLILFPANDRAAPSTT